MKLMPKLVLLSFIASPAFAGDIKEIRFGVEPAYAPFEFRDPNGKMQGFDIDLGNELCLTLKAKCTWVEIPFDGLIPSLLSKKIDAINSALSITEPRKKSINFTQPLYQVPTQLVASKNSNLLPTAESLKGKKVGVLQSSTQESYAKSHWGGKGVTIISYLNMGLVYTDLNSGRLDATLAESLSAVTSFLAKPQGRNFELKGTPVQDEKILGNGIGIGVRKGDPQLKDQLDKAFQQIKENGTYGKLMKKHFPIDISMN